MHDPKNNASRSSRGKNTEVESPRFPRDGQPVRGKIPPKVWEEARKRRDNRPFIRFRCVGIRGRKCGFEFPDFPDVGTVWVDLAARANEAQREGKQ